MNKFRNILHNFKGDAVIQESFIVRFALICLINYQNQVICERLGFVVRLFLRRFGKTHNFIFADMLEFETKKAPPNLYSAGQSFIDNISVSALAEFMKRPQVGTLNRRLTITLCIIPDILILSSDLGKIFSLLLRRAFPGGLKPELWCYLRSVF